MLRKMRKECGIKDMRYITEFMKKLTAEMIQAVLDAEMEHELGYSKYNCSKKQTKNSRNGYLKKTVQSCAGEMEIRIPRDRQGKYEPRLLKKYQRNVSSIEDKIISLYSQDILMLDIQKTIWEMYGIDEDAGFISTITEKILPLIQKWHNRPLQNVYAMMLLDAVYDHVPGKRSITGKAVYVARGIDLDGGRDILGIWLGAGESSKLWHSAFNDLKRRGVQHILIASVDGPPGFVEAIHSAYPETEIQRCLMHQIRFSTRYVSRHDLKQFTADLMPIYRAPTKEVAFSALDELEAKWGGKYPLAVKPWRIHWNELSTMFRYSPEIRKLIYTTNTLESFQ